MKKEAVIVRRIFEQYCSGKSPKKIAHDLNRKGIPGPSGRHWGFSTINGSAKRGNGILNNELYIGRIVWNRQSFVKDPDMAGAGPALNPKSEWITQDVPALRIVSDDLWQTAKGRQRRTEKQNALDEEPRFRDWRCPRYILSGLTKCGCCGGGYSMISSATLGRSTARNKGTCDNKLNIRRDELEAGFSKPSDASLWTPLFSRHSVRSSRETNRLRSQARVAMERARAEIRKIDRELEMLVELILQGGAGADQQEDGGLGETEGRARSQTRSSEIPSAKPSPRDGVVLSKTNRRALREPER